MRLEIYPKIALPPGKGLPEQIPVDEKLAYDSSGGGILLSTAIVSQARAQLNRFPLAPAVRRPGISAARTAQNSYLAGRLRPTQNEIVIFIHTYL